MTQDKRVMLIASGGGHWVQLSRMSPAFEGFDTLYVTTLAGSHAPSGTRPVRIVQDASRQTPFRMIWLILQLIGIIVSFRPRVVITTGAAPGVLALQIARLTGAKTVWIDSIANAEELSLSGRLAKKHADLWLTQWPHLLEKYPGIQCYGAIL